MIYAVDDRTSNNAQFGPVVTKWRGIVNWPSDPNVSATLKQWFVETDLLSILKEWCDYSDNIFKSYQETIGQALDAYDVARCWLWMLRDPDVNERPDLMPKLSAEFETSCRNLELFVRTFLNEIDQWGDCDNWTATVALSLMIERAKGELKAAQGWE